MGGLAGGGGGGGPRAGLTCWLGPPDYIGLHNWFLPANITNITMTGLLAGQAQFISPRPGYPARSHQPPVRQSHHAKLSKVRKTLKTQCLYGLGLVTTQGEEVFIGTLLCHASWLQMAVAVKSARIFETILPLEQILQPDTTLTLFS